METPPTDDPQADPDGDGIVNEIPTSIVDFMEFYRLNYFKPGVYRQTNETEVGRRIFERVGCAQCHIPDLQINRDRRVADLDTIYDLAARDLQQLICDGSSVIQCPGRWQRLPGTEIT